MAGRQELEGQNDVWCFLSLRAARCHFRWVMWYRAVWSWSRKHSWWQIPRRKVLFALWDMSRWAVAIGRVSCCCLGGERGAAGHSVFEERTVHFVVISSSSEIEWDLSSDFLLHLIERTTPLLLGNPGNLWKANVSDSSCLIYSRRGVHCGWHSDALRSRLNTIPICPVLLALWFQAVGVGVYQTAM